MPIGPSAGGQSCEGYHSPLHSDGDGMMMSSLIVGLVIGAVHGTFERGQGTSDYTAHRGISFARQNVVASLVILVASTCWFLWPPLIWEFVPDTHAVQEPMLDSIMICSVILGGFGIKMWVPAILVFGLSAAIARLIFDSRGRWRRQRAQREPAPPPLLQTVEF